MPFQVPVEHVAARDLQPGDVVCVKWTERHTVRYEIKTLDRVDTSEEMAVYCDGEQFDMQGFRAQCDARFRLDAEMSRVVPDALFADEMVWVV